MWEKIKPGNYMKDHREARIEGGENVTSAEEVPYFVFIEAGKSFCGGTIVQKNAIITSAHCFLGYPRQIKVKAGFWNADLNPEQTRFARKVIPHQEYKKHTFINDIAVVCLKRILIAPVCQRRLNSSLDWFNSTWMFLDPATNTCAGRLDKGGRKGDSGGGLVARINGETVLIGVESQGMKLNQTNIFVRISAYKTNFLDPALASCNRP